MAPIHFSNCLVADDGQVFRTYIRYRLHFVFGDGVFAQDRAGVIDLGQNRIAVTSKH